MAGLGSLLRVACVATLIGTVACSGPLPETEQIPHDPLEPLGIPTVEPVPEELPAIVTRINTQHITGDELERAVRSAEIQAGQALPSQFRDQVYRSVLERLVSFHLLLQESQTRNISATDAEVEEHIDRLRGNFPTEEAFKSQLTAWDTTLDILREETRRDLLVERVLDAAVTADVAIDADTTREFYEAHTDQFIQGGSAHARHILIGVSPDADEETKTEARERAEELRQEAQEGADFAGLARAHSEDPGSAENGGDLGRVSKGQTVPDFEAALFELETGGISDVVETPFGFHIIQLLDLEESRTVAFAEASIQIREFLLNQERQAQTEAFVAELRANNDVEVLF